MAEPRAVEVLRMLGISPEDIESLRNLPYPDASKGLEALKDKVRRNWRRTIFDLHPDRTGNDPEKTALFQELTRAKEALEAWKLEEPRRVVVSKPVVRKPQPRTPRPTTPNPTAYRAATMKP